MLLRTISFCLALGAPGLAAADQFPDSAQQLEVRGDEGTVLSRVESVERDANGRIISVEAPGLEPDDAPASSDLVAENEPEHFFASYPTAQRNDRDQRGGGSVTRAR